VKKGSWFNLIAKKGRRTDREKQKIGKRREKEEWSSAEKMEE